MLEKRALLGSVVIVALAVGCNNSGGGSRGSASTVAGSTQVATTTSTTTSTTAPAVTSSTVAPGVVTPVATASYATASKNGPEITLSSPARASFTTQSVIKVEGTAKDASGVLGVAVQGVPITFSTSGTFGTTIQLNPGLNVVIVEAWNGLGRRSKASVSVVSGTFQPDTIPVKDAFALRLNKGAFDAISKAAASKIGGAMLAQQIMAKNPLYNGSASALGVTLASATVNATHATFGQPTLSLSPVVGALAVHCEIPNVDVEVNATGKVTGIGYSITGHVTATNAVVDAQCVVQIQNGKLVTSVQNANVDLQGFKWGINNFPSLLTNLASSFVKKLIEDEIEKQIATVVPQEVNKALGGIAAPITQTVLGATATFTFTPTFVGFDANGNTSIADANVTMTPVAGWTPLPSPGSLVSGGGLPAFSATGPHFTAAANEDLMNRVGHSAWKAGILHLVIDKSSASVFKIPAWLPLDAGLLMAFLPELKGKLNPSDPISLHFTPRLPPIFAARTKPDPIEAALGDMALQVYAEPAGQPKKLILELALHARIQAGAALSPASQLTVSVPQRPFVDVSLASSPLVTNLDFLGVTNLVQFVVPPLVQIMSSQWSGFPVPVYPGLAPKNVDIDSDGTKKTFLKVSGDF